MRQSMVFLISLLFAFSAVQAQDESKRKKKSEINLSGRSNDHLLVQFGYAGWSGAPDTINIKGLSTSFNAYFLFDFPFKTNPKMSAAIGAGIGSDNIKFKDTYVGIKDNTSTIAFTNKANAEHFKKTKLTNVYLEAPVELRYSSDPENNLKSFKVALGVKVGTMLLARVKNKTLENASGNTINDYVQKEASKKFFNSTRVVGTLRVGYGPASIFGNYQLSKLFKEGVAASINPYTIGITLSGL